MSESGTPNIDIEAETEAFQARVVHDLEAKVEQFRELVEYVLACVGNDYIVDDAWVDRAEAALRPR